ncbi:MAG: Mpo1-like protein [Phycisphaerae bacterium]
MPMTLPNWLQNWLLRHQSRISLVLHIIGIPLTIVALVLAGWQLYHGMWDLWWRPKVLFVLGYLLQFIGHTYEGNDMGEVILVKKLLGKPYVAISPKYGGTTLPESASVTEFKAAGGKRQTTSG